MTEAQYRKIALGFDGAVEQSHMGHPDFRLGGRIFATLHGNNKTGALMLTPEQQKQFLNHKSGAFTPAAGAWGLQGATVVEIKLADEETVGEAMTLAFQTAVAKGPTTSNAKGTKKTKKTTKSRSARN